MKRIIDGVTYNTATATLVARSDFKDESMGVEEESHLYQTRGGAFFIWTHKETTTYDRREAENITKVFDSFEPVTREYAEKWVITGEVELVSDDVFAEPPEAVAEEKAAATLYVRVPEILKNRIEKAAKAQGVSVNSFMIRCAENCVSDVGAE